MWCSFSPHHSSCFGASCIGGLVWSHRALRVRALRSLKLLVLLLCDLRKKKKASAVVAVFVLAFNSLLSFAYHMCVCVFTFDFRWRLCLGFVGWVPCQCNAIWVGLCVCLGLLMCGIHGCKCLRALNAFWQWSTAGHGAERSCRLCCHLASWTVVRGRGLMKFSGNLSGENCCSLFLFFFLFCIFCTHMHGMG